MSMQILQSIAKKARLWRVWRSEQIYYMKLIQIRYICTIKTAKFYKTKKSDKEVMN